jgi:hypothetical protein
MEDGKPQDKVLADLVLGKGSYQEKNTIGWVIYNV